MNEDYEKDMNDLIISFNQYSTDFTKSACTYYGDYLRKYQKEKIQLEAKLEALKHYLILCANFGTKEETYPYEHILSKMQELEEGGNNDC